MSGKVITDILRNGKSDRPGFWHGNPHRDTEILYSKALGLDPDREDHDIDLALALGSDLIWISAEWGSYHSPDGSPVWDFYGGREKHSLSEPGAFAECEDVKDVEKFPWPDPDYLDFSGYAEKVKKAKERGLSVIGGMWMPFFHVVADFFGMDNYFIKMYTHPQVVHAVTTKVLEFYQEANRRCLPLVKDTLDAGFFGNDFGSQRDLLISPESFDEFVLPGTKMLADTIKEQNMPVITHSCGAISRVIPRLIDSGIEALHPLQANAVGMAAEDLAREFKGDLVFIGGVDTQHLLPFESSDKVRLRVSQLMDLFGDAYVVSPSHEAILPNVPLKNVQAMVDTVKKQNWS